MVDGCRQDVLQRVKARWARRSDNHGFSIGVKMMDKYLIRETSVPNKPPFVGMYFAGFLPGGRGATLVFGKKDAQKYDTLEAVTRILFKIKEFSNRNTWRWELANPDHAFEFGHKDEKYLCRRCNTHISNHGDAPSE